MCVVPNLFCYNIIITGEPVKMFAGEVGGSNL